MDLQKCLPIAVKENNKDRLIFFHIKKDAVDLQKCLPIAVNENTKDRLIFFHIKKRRGGSSKVPSYRCEL